MRTDSGKAVSGIDFSRHIGVDFGLNIMAIIPEVLDASSQAIDAEQANSLQSTDAPLVALIVVLMEVAEELVLLTNLGHEILSG